MKKLPKSMRLRKFSFVGAEGLVEAKRRSPKGKPPTNFKQKASPLGKAFVGAEGLEPPTPSV